MTSLQLKKLAGFFGDEAKEANSRCHPGTQSFHTDMVVARVMLGIGKALMDFARELEKEGK